MTIQTGDKVPRPTRREVEQLRLRLLLQQAAEADTAGDSLRILLGRELRQMVMRRERSAFPPLPPWDLGRLAWLLGRHAARQGQRRRQDPGHLYTRLLANKGPLSASISLAWANGWEHEEGLRRTSPWRDVLARRSPTSASVPRK